MLLYKEIKVFKLASSLFFFGFMVGCASIENYPPLENAKNSYSQLQQNEDVRKYGAAELYDANQLINKAESAANNNDKELLDHYIYLSENNLKLVEVVASNKKNEAYI